MVSEKKWNAIFVIKSSLATTLFKHEIPVVHWTNIKVIKSVSINEKIYILEIYRNHYKEEPFLYYSKENLREDKS